MAVASRARADQSGASTARGAEGAATRASTTRTARVGRCLHITNPPSERARPREAIMTVLYNPGVRKLWRDVLDRIAPYDAGRPLEVVAAELGLAHLVRLSANENPLGPSPRAIRAIADDARNAHLYPD